MGKRCLQTIRGLLVIYSFAVSAQLMLALFLPLPHFIQTETTTVGLSMISGETNEDINISLHNCAIFCYYFAVVPSLFASLSFVFGVYTSDHNTWNLGIALMGFASVLMFTGILVFAGAAWHRIRSAGLGVPFLLCIAVGVQMGMQATASWIVRIKPSVKLASSSRSDIV